jgi:HAE1 family hydrophobic/amphiphilic exporter-1
MEEEHCLLKATKKAMHEIAGAIVAITFLMAAVFQLPLCLVQWSFIRQFAITMATAIILSGIVALTLTPALCAIMLRNNMVKQKRKLYK